MKIKTNELQGAALDWAVALIEYPQWKEQGYLECFPHDLHFDDGEVYSPSTDWAQSGPIIERENINLLKRDERPWFGYAYRYGKYKKLSGQRGCQIFSMDGPTPLIAAMRSYVASKLGDEVEIPAEMEAIS